MSDFNVAGSSRDHATVVEVDKVNQDVDLAQRDCVSNREVNESTDAGNVIDQLEKVTEDIDNMLSEVIDHRQNVPIYLSAMMREEGDALVKALTTAPIQLPDSTPDQDNELQAKLRKLVFVAQHLKDNQEYVKNCRIKQ